MLPPDQDDIDLHHASVHEIFVYLSGQVVILDQYKNERKIQRDLIRQIQHPNT